MSSAVMKSEPVCFASALVFLLVSVFNCDAAGTGKSAVPSAQPKVGIDTTFGERFKAAASAQRADRPEEVIATTTVALEMNPDPKNAAILLNWRGLANFSLANFSQALADLNRAIRRDPRADYAHANRALLYIQRGEFAPAVSDLSEELRIHPKRVDLYGMRGSAYLRLNQRERARSDYQRALGARVRTGSDYARRAKVYFFSGDYRQAASDYTRAKRLNGDDGSVLNQVAWFEATCPDAAVRDGKAAIRDATRACELMKWKDSRIVDTLAAAYAEVGDFDRASRLATQAIRTSNFSPYERAEIREHLRAFQERKPWRDETKL